MYLYALLAVSTRQIFWVYSLFGSSHLLIMVCRISVSFFPYMFSPVLFIRLCTLVFFIERNVCFTMQEAHVLRVLENKVRRGTSQLKIEKLTAE